MIKRFVLTLLACVLLSGCGATIAVNMRLEADDNPFYGMTCFETLLLYAMVKGDDLGYHFPAPPGYYSPFVIADIPFTALTETVLLPVDAYKHLRAARAAMAERGTAGNASRGGFELTTVTNACGYPLAPDITNLVELL